MICSLRRLPLPSLQKCMRYSASLIHQQSTDQLNSVIPKNFLPYLDRISDAYSDDYDPRKLKLLSDPVSALKVKITEYEDLNGFLNSENDPELRELAESDLKSLVGDVKDLVDVITDRILPVEKFDQQNAMMEVVPGAGGLEAAMFAEEIFDMYLEYVRSMGCHAEIVELVKSSVGKQTKFVSDTGITKGVALITGEQVFRKLKFECGVHRVQRVPVTGTKSDRLQTSTCSVAVLPEPKDIDIKLDKRDLKFEYMRSKGAGGQSVNTADSACRVTHLPTGITIECQEERSQIKNQKKALKKLQSRLYQMDFENDLKVTTSSRKLQIGNMNRNEKIRTYNYNRHMITDHRIGEAKVLQNMSLFLTGGLGFSVLEEFHEGLLQVDKEERLKQLLITVK